MRTIVDIPKEQIVRLDELARKERRSRASVVREAVGVYLSQKHPETFSTSAFGIWRHAGLDGVVYQQQLRDEWEREE